MDNNIDLKNEKRALKVSKMSIEINAALSAVKLFCGILGRSAAMVSDAVHSLSDVLSTVAVIIGIKLAARKSDADHSYGHERFEPVAAVVLSGMLAITGALIGVSGIKKIIYYDVSSFEAPTFLAAAAAVVSILVKEIMYRYTALAAKQINSDALMADAWHHRSDALSSIGSLIGIAGAMAGFHLLDPIASVIICLFILRAAYEIFRDATDKLVDKACDEETESDMKRVVSETEGVISLDDIKTRLFGAKIYVDIEISAEKDLSLTDAHKIAQNVHDNIEKGFPLVKHCMVHVNPK
ncbi:MAG: cation diffusion facilitator family transporter [Clostridiales bacterium]|nr:cation diffusion facilitator family transporter [Clostridiales bacterium]